MNPRTLALFIALAFAGSAAAAVPQIPSNDWHLLWPDSKKDEWIAKPENELRALATAGHAAAQYALYRKNWGTEEAARMLDAAVAAGLPQAIFDKQFDLSPPGLNRTPESWAMLQKSAEAGFPNARLRVGQFDAGFINDGSELRNRMRFPPPNFPRAVAYLRDAADNGLTDALIPLALLYSSGIAVPRNPAETPHELLLKAARAGEGYAMKHLSKRYLHGHGERRDLLEAARWHYLFLHTPYSGSSTLLDHDWKPRSQNSVAARELAGLVSLFVLSFDHDDSAAVAELGRRYAQVKRFTEALTLLRLAKRGGAVVDMELEALAQTLSPEQLKGAATSTTFPPRL